MNYLASAYGIYAASALAGNAVTRSIVGGTLPLAGPSMYAAMTPQWAGMLLGLLELAMVPIPIVFYRYGERIRSKSKVIRQLREDQERNDRRAEGTRQRRARLGKSAGSGEVVEGVRTTAMIEPIRSKDESAV